MNPYPHHYEVRAAGKTDDGVEISSEQLQPLHTAPPAQFGGPGDQWSPETLLVAAAADCFILTFRAIARASNLAWSDLTCDADGKLDRVDGITRFTALTLHARLVLPADADVDRARRLLDKAEKACLITNSLAVPASLKSEVLIGDEAR
jgi:peroxiredoxin-like protein